MNPIYKDKAKLEELRQEYMFNDPYPHIVLDDFWDIDQLNKATDELEELPMEIWTKHRDPMANDTIVQRKKFGLNMTSMLEGKAPLIERIMNYMNSPEMVDWISDLTGIPDLKPDPFNTGGGIHKSLKGGKLAIHADFNIHHKLKLHRRVNILLYLNRDWDEAWHGELEMWDKYMNACHKRVFPHFNKVVIFNTTDTALHGHPIPLDCPEDRSRLSLAYYYYSEDRPEAEKSNPRETLWFKRPKDGY
tara:strand:+ start:4079 stop:4819 length:741 start_codon:yes stop_codon:yes gene_type:complete